MKLLMVFRQEEPAQAVLGWSQQLYPQYAFWLEHVRDSTEWVLYSTVLDVDRDLVVVRARSFYIEWLQAHYTPNSRAKGA